MKKIISIIVAIVIVGFGFWLWSTIKPESKQEVILDPQNATYVIEGQEVVLIDGESKEETLSESEMMTQYFGNETKGDFNNDGIEDAVFLLVQDGGGSGVFYYVAVVLGTVDNYKGTNAIFIGDRIAPQTTEFRDGEIIVNYAERKSDEPMTAEPSIGVSRYFKISGDELVEILK